MKLYYIEDTDLEALDKVAKQLYTENKLNGDEMRDLAHMISYVTKNIKNMPCEESE